MKKYTTGVIGTGFIGVAHIEALRRLGNVNVVAICDMNDVENTAKKIFVDKYYTDYKLMINENSFDFVHICTPNNTHYEIAKYALENDVNVVLEKPMAFSTEEALELKTLAKEKGLTCAINFHNRLYPTSVFMKNHIQDGNVGDIISVHGEYTQDWLLYQNDYSWRLHKEESGKTRAVADIGSHWLDLIQYVTGLNIVEVCADFSTVYPVRLKSTGENLSFTTHTKEETYEEVSIDTEDIASILFRLENGAIGNVFVSQMVAGNKNNLQFTISGTKASLTWRLHDHEVVMIGNRGASSQKVVKDGLMMSCSQNQIDYPAGHLEGFPDAIKQVFKEVYNGNSNLYANFNDGYNIMVLADKIYDSAISKKWIKVMGDEQ